MTIRTRILVVDDDALVLRLAKRLLRPLDMDVCTAGSTEDALEELDAGPVSLVLTDLRMGGAGGDVLLDRIRLRWPTLPVVVMTSHGSIDIAVDLMKRGATDFVSKPLEPSLLPRIEYALSRASLEVEVRDLRARLGAAGEPSRPLVGDAPAFRKVIDRLAPAARADACVLIRGETGTGKELVARALHDLSPRAGGPFVAINCGALPEQLLESELFGHVKGAFTDARGDKRGLVCDAEGGTLFLDEVGDMPLALQVKLLRFLQEGEVRPVGGNRSVRVDVRVVAATHRDVHTAIAVGDFREDLFYRLNVIPLTLPPLRERREDVPALAAHILRRATSGSNREGVTLTPAALAELVAHPWPGNVRELENVLQRAVIFATGVAIDAADIEFDPAGPLPDSAAVEPDLSVPLRVAKEALVAEFEQAYVEAALRASAGNVSQAARRAGKDRKSFHELIQRYAVEVDRHRA